MTLRQVSFLLLYYRRIFKAGDCAILVEYGQMKLDFDLRARAHALESETRKRQVDDVALCIGSTMVKAF